MSQAFAHFINGPLDGTKTKLESAPPNIWKTPGHLMIGVQTMSEESVGPTEFKLYPVHLYYLCFAKDYTYIYIYEGQER